MRLRTYDSARTTIDGDTPSAPARAIVADAAPSPQSNLNDGPETWTVAPAADSGTTAQRATPLTPREQRYNELLRTPPPPAPPAPEPQQSPSLLERVVTPIANALGVRREKPEPPANVVRPQPPQPRPARTADTVTPRPDTMPDSSTSTTQPQQKSTEPTDAESDVVPPQLLAAEFVPPQIRDGEETAFAVMAHDDRSGVRTVSGVIASPSGSIQGFSCIREGDSNRFVARVRVPPEAPEGTWVVKYLTLTDNTGNISNVNAAQGGLPATASFRVVSSAPDSSGPQLRAVWLDHQVMRSGEKNTIFVQAEDDKSGVRLVSGTFVSPSKNARIGFGCKEGTAGVWDCLISPPVCLDCGVWKLEQVQLQDKAQNLSTFRAENPLVRDVFMDLSGESCDAVAPVITTLTFGPPVVSNGQANTIQVQATVQDEGGCGVASLSGQVTAPGGVGGQRQQIMFRKESETSFSGTINLPAGAAQGVWTVAWIQAADKGNNVRAYSSNDPALARATFTVE